MSSYAKQMMEVAAKWMKANPDPGSGFLNIPGLEKSKERRTAIIRDQQITALHRKVEKMDKLKPELRAQLEPLLADVDEQLSVMHELSDDLISKEEELEGLLNEVPTPSQDKNRVESVLHADLGRWCLAWGRHGHNVFELSPDFTAAMLLTDPTAIDIKAAKLPFGGLLITIPTGFAVGVEGMSYTKIHVWEMPKMHIEQLDVGHKIIDAMKGLSTEAKASILSKVEKNLEDAPPRLLVPKIDENAKAFCIYATDGAHVLDTLIEFKDLSWKNIEALPDSVTEDTDRQCRRTLQQIVFGMLAYVSVVERSVTERESTEKRRKKRKHDAAKPKHWEVGRTIKLDQNLVHAARSGSREIALRIKTRFIVRGHYRNQAHGPKRSERTSRWIAPFWKGPEEGARIIHTYKLDELVETNAVKT